MNTLYPLLFEPNLHTVVWGGDRLCPYKGLEPKQEPIGESWEVSAVPSSTDVVSNGVFKGQDLIYVINQNPEGILGKSVAERYGGKLPLLVKFIDAKRDLSSGTWETIEDNTCVILTEAVNSKDRKSVV